MFTDQLDFMAPRALVKLGGGVTDIRGSIGGTTFSRGKGGNIARSNKKPCNPRSSRQETRRALMSWITKCWSDTLTDQQRTDWRAYAAGTGWTNRLGEAIEINGLAAFLQLNALYMLPSPTLHAAAPTAMGHAGGVTLTFAAESDTKFIQIDAPGGAYDNDTDFHNIWMFGGLPSEPGRDAIPNGFRYLGRLEGGKEPAITYPAQLEFPYTMAAGQIITVRYVFTDDHHRTGATLYATDVAAPSA